MKISVKIKHTVYVIQIPSNLFFSRITMDLFVNMDDLIKSSDQHQLLPGLDVVVIFKKLFRWHKDSSYMLVWWILHNRF